MKVRIAGLMVLVIALFAVSASAQPMIDYFLAFEESCNLFPGFSYEVQGVYQEHEGDGVRFYTYVVREDARRAS